MMTSVQATKMLYVIRPHPAEAGKFDFQIYRQIGNTPHEKLDDGTASMFTIHQLMQQQQDLGHFVFYNEGAGIRIWNPMQHEINAVTFGMAITAPFANKPN